MAVAVEGVGEAAAASERAPIVVARHVTRRYGEGAAAVDALRGVSLTIPERDLTAIMGPSGSGKTTLMHCLAGLDQPTGREIEIRGASITRMKNNDLPELRRRDIGF